MISRLSTIYESVKRTSLNVPGFFHQELSERLSSHDLRTAMVTVGDHLIDRIKRDLGVSMNYFSMGRVDQKSTTKIHLDGAPPKSILILGYEPSSIQSSVSVIDYSRYCFDNGLSTSEFLKNFNPMYSAGINFSPYLKAMSGFNPAKSNIIVINNSSCDCSSQGMCGLMHLAVVQPGNGSRIINTINIADLSLSENAALGEAEKQKFVDITEVNVSYVG